jgi:hypothetical protein
MTVFAHEIAFGFGLALIGFSGFIGVGRLGRAVSGCLVNAGWHRVSRWLTGALVDPNAVDVDVCELIEQALDSADPAAVRLPLALADLPVHQ